jgi:drug/metabolite transporter (DMT)-like permease
MHDGTLLALASAACYGASDVLGGLLSRRASFLTVTLLGQLGGLALALVAAPLATTTSLTFADLGWGALSGVGTAVGMLFLFRGLAHGALSLVVPVSAVTGIALPVLAGVALLGDRPPPLAWLGIGAAVPALWLVGRSREGPEGDSGSALTDGLVAGAGVALQYLALAQVGPAAGLWPIVAGRVAAIVTVLPWARSLCTRLPWRPALVAASTGALAALALVCYLEATRRQLLTVSVVLSSFYPVLPVLVGVAFLRERVSTHQALGLLGATAAIGLLATG